MRQSAVYGSYGAVLDYTLRSRDYTPHRTFAPDQEYNVLYASLSRPTASLAIGLVTAFWGAQKTGQQVTDCCRLSKANVVRKQLRLFVSGVAGKFG